MLTAQIWHKIAIVAAIYIVLTINFPLNAMVAMAINSVFRRCDEFLSLLQ